MPVGGHIRIYLAVYGPEIIGGFGLEKKSKKAKTVCGLERTNYEGLRNVRPPHNRPSLRATTVIINRPLYLHYQQNASSAQSSTAGNWFIRMRTTIVTSALGRKSRRLWTQKTV